MVSLNQNGLSINKNWVSLRLKKIKMLQLAVEHSKLKPTFCARQIGWQEVTLEDYSEFSFFCKTNLSFIENVFIVTVSKLKCVEIHNNKIYQEITQVIVNDKNFSRTLVMRVKIYFNATGCENITSSPGT